MALSAAEEELIATRTRLTEADTMVAGMIVSEEPCFFSLIFIPIFLMTLFLLDLSAMTAQLENLRLVANDATAAVNARGETLEFRLQDIRVCAKEIALHGVRHGAAVALAAAQVQPVLDLHAVEPGFPMADNPEEHEDLVGELAGHAAAVAEITPPEDILNQVFLED